MTHVNLLEQRVGPAGVWKLLAVASAILLVDGQLGPLSFASRMVIAVALLAFIGALRLRHAGKGRFLWAGGLMAGLVLFLHIPSVPIAILFLVVGVAVTNLGSERCAAYSRLPEGSTQALLTYAAIGFVVGLVPQAGAVGTTVGSVVNQYVDRVRGLGADVSLTAVGEPAVLLGVLLLLWNWRCVGGPGRLIAAAVLPLAWFASLALSARGASGGPSEVYGYGIMGGLFCLAAASFACSLIPSPKPRSSVARVVRHRRRFLIGACVAALLAGVCLVGTAMIGPPKAKAILVHNRGGLDWDRPVFGKFGAFSGGMFGANRLGR